MAIVITTMSKHMKTMCKVYNIETALKVLNKSANTHLMKLQKDESCPWDIHQCSDYSLQKPLQV